MPRRLRQLVSSEEAVAATCQHTKPCSDCPWARRSLAGWLGGQDPNGWLAAAHGDGIVECHTLLGAQCAGVAIYRANVYKRPRAEEALRLPRDTERVFGNPMEFTQHHLAGPTRIGRE